MVICLFMKNILILFIKSSSQLTYHNKNTDILSVMYDINTMVDYWYNYE